MIRSFTLFLSFILIFSCKQSDKDTVTVPDLATTLIGSYKITQMELGYFYHASEAGPYNFSDGQVIITRDSASSDKVNINSYYTLTSPHGNFKYTEAALVRLQEINKRTYFYGTSSSNSYSILGFQHSSDGVITMNFLEKSITAIKQ